MVAFEVFLIGLMIVSTLTSLVTEAVKKIFTEHNKVYRSNTIAGIIAAFLSVFVGCGYFVIAGTPFTAQAVVCLIALVFMSWLCSMIGYDKVVQVITQFKTTTKD